MARGVSIDRETLVDEQVGELCKNFKDYLAEFNRKPLYGDTLCQHKKILSMREELGGVAKSIESDKYLLELRSMLVAWGMDSRGAVLKEDNEFVKSVRKCRDDIVSLEEKRVAHFDEDSAERLWRIIEKMELSQTESQMVTGAKALHHLLPQLLPPIDVTYTGRFFHYHNYNPQSQPEEAFKLMFSYFARIARKVYVWQYVGMADWATSQSKVIDNAIIGYCNRHPDMPVGLEKAAEWRAQKFIAELGRSIPSEDDPTEQVQRSTYLKNI